MYSELEEIREIINYHVNDKYYKKTTQRQDKIYGFFLNICFLYKKRFTKIYRFKLLRNDCETGARGC